MARAATLKHVRKAGALANGDLAIGEWGLDTTNNVWYYSLDGSTVRQLVTGLPAGHIFGLGMSNAADANNDITVAAGKCRSEDDTEDLVLAAPITKQLDAGWAVGNNAGGLNTGAEAS